MADSDVKRASVGCLIVSSICVALLFLFVSLFSGDDTWPLTVKSGDLVCQGTPDWHLVWFKDENGRYWPLNGLAMSAGEKRGAPYQPNIKPIQRRDEANPGLWMSVDSLRAKAAKLCKK